MKENSSRQRYVFLDGLRGVAALAIVIHHFTQHSVGHRAVFSSAAIGVELFFCLGGFVLANPYHERLILGINPACEEASATPVSNDHDAIGSPVTMVRNLPLAPRRSTSCLATSRTGTTRYGCVQVWATNPRPSLSARAFQLARGC